MTEMQDRDDRIARALRALDPQAELDDLAYERLARRISAAGAERLRGRPSPAWHAFAARWARALVPLGLAASFAVVASLAMDRGMGDQSSRDRPAEGSAALGLRVPNGDSLLAATVGVVPEDEFLSGLWDHMDAEVLLTESVHP
jgi:hypothetical protein